ncbi:hypothetical protein [Mariprofundus ferrooxydans]|uniref:hypothetical protein n=1 Tax=Mariprofundus ferrooxydans TaxID=314344 RepID=UPI0002EC4C36|nr:hypothetical protein [Mariprofundus ferrooxydans]
MSIAVCLFFYVKEALSVCRDGRLAGDMMAAYNLWPVFCYLQIVKYLRNAPLIGA